MNILVTGAAGFVGKNLVAALENIKNGYDRTRGALTVDELLLYDVDTDPAALADYCQRADFVFHLAGANRPTDPTDFQRVNAGLTATLLAALERAGNTCPVMLASSIRASLSDPYGESKRRGEELVLDHAAHTGAAALIYRLPNLFGKWCRPNYNSVVATFCHNIARDLPITVNNPATELELVYIDDLVEELLGALAGAAHACAPDSPYYGVPTSHRVTLGEIEALLRRFAAQQETLTLPPMPADSFEKKLCATYLSYLPPARVAYPLQMRTDDRGSFTEVLRGENYGQFSVNISAPGAVKGRHWHHSKWELFVVVAGEGLIRQRQLHSREVLELYVSGERLIAVQILPGYTHELVNLSPTKELVTLMWASEPFDPAHPDTFFKEVDT